MIIRDQCEEFLRASEHRRRRPARPATLRAYRSYTENWIIPEIGDMELAAVDNRTARDLIGKMTEAGLACRTVNAVVNCLKGVMSSAVDQNGNEIFPRTWNSDYMDLPVIEKGSEGSVVGQEALQQAISRARGADKALYGLLAGTGLRIGEALSLSTVDTPGLSFWDTKAAVIHVRSTLDHREGEVRPNPKTVAGVRSVDIPKALNDFLLQVAPTGAGLLFQKADRPLVYSTVLRRMHSNGIPEAFHAFRRFRVTHLEGQNVSRGLIQFWTGHAAQNVTDSYVKIGQNIDIRRRECERAGLGFELPEAS